MPFLSIRDALLQGTRLLEDGAVIAPRLTAEVLLAHALHRDRTYLYSHSDVELREGEWIHYGRYLNERLTGKPTQYITRRQEFYGRVFRVTPDVLIPRPETEHAVEAALAFGGARRIVDVGCGSGALAVTLRLETGAEVWATDLSLAALSVARANAESLGARVTFAACDLASAFAPRSFDLVVSNPPYVPHPEIPHLQREVRDWEPAIALDGGPTGFEIYERLIADAARVLRPDGGLVMEVGYNGAGRVRELASLRFGDIRDVPDLQGYPRVVACRLLR